MSKSWKKKDKNNETISYKQFSGRCIPECPSEEGYKEDPANPTTCIKCSGPCPKICEGSAHITSVADAQKFKGCTKIDGNVEITVKGTTGGNIIKELEDNFKDLEVITGFLKIFRSSPLITLHFFKSLKTIEGRTKDRENYTLLVIDNPNLQELFPWNKDRNFTIKEGKIFFHINPKLCINKIEEMDKLVNMKETWDRKHDVSEFTNGDKIACENVDLNLKVTDTRKNTAILQWKNFKLDKDSQLHDPRDLLGYTILYREAPSSGPVDMFEGRDGCSTDQWMARDHSASQDGKNPTTGKDYEEVYDIIGNLKPNTRYALFVKTYGTNNFKVGGDTPIIYFKTKAHTPNKPEDIKVEKSASHDGIVTIEWKAPRVPNGNISYYRINVEEILDEPEFAEKESCEELIFKETSGSRSSKLQDKSKSSSQTMASSSGPDDSINTTETSKRPTLNDLIDSNRKVFGKEDCCSCTPKKQTHQVAEEVEEKTRFEDWLHEHVYVKHAGASSMQEMVNEGRKKRSVDGGTDGNLLSLIKHDLSTTTTTTTTTDKSMTTESTEASAGVASTGESINTTTEVSTAVAPKRELQKFSMIVNATESGVQTLNLKDLRHYAGYSIKIEACLDKKPDGDSSQCSPDEMAYIRTQEKAGVDDIPETPKVMVNRTTSSVEVQIRWKEPQDPNGLILAYQINYKRDGRDTYITHCIKRTEYLNNGTVLTLKKLDPGKYTLQVRAKSLASVGNWSESVTFEVPDLEAMELWILIAAGLVGGVFIVFAASIVSYGVFQKFSKDRFNRWNYISMNPDYHPAYQADHWEVDRDNLQIGTELGKGAFGMVYNGYIFKFDDDKKEKERLYECAVKTVNLKDARPEAHQFIKNDFLNEATVMK